MTPHFMHMYSSLYTYISHIYIYKNVNVRLCTNGTQKHVNFRKFFTDGVAIWTQRCRRICACLDITLYIYIYIYYIYIDVKTCFYAFTVKRWRCLSTEGM
jgi:hypothetical protein